MAGQADKDYVDERNEQKETQVDSGPTQSSSLTTVALFGPHTGEFFPPPFAPAFKTRVDGWSHRMKSTS